MHSKKFSAINNNSLGVIDSLLNMAWFVEARDPYTGGHLWRVSNYAQRLAQALEFSPEQIAQITLGGFLHDLGKTCTPDQILRKASALADDEYAIMKTHPSVGMRMLANHPLAELVADAVLLHHERPDGKGYPNGLTQEQIPDMAHIIAICDAFDAMTSTRPYRQGMPRDKALGILEQAQGTQFNANFTRVFVELGHQGELDHIISHSDEGIPMLTCPACGPILVVFAETKAGDHLHCRNCTGEFELQIENEVLIPKFTGNYGQANDLEPIADNNLLHRMAASLLKHLPAENELAG